MVEGRQARTMALDVGDRRIGIAVTDPLGLTVQARPTRQRTTLQEDIGHIRRLVEEDGVETVIVGHPLRMNGARSRQTEKTEAFTHSLQAALSVPVLLWDERLTTFAARQHMEDLGMSWRRRRRYIDAMAAALILEDYLSRKS